VARTLAGLYLGRQTFSPPGSGLARFTGVPVLGPAFAILNPGAPAVVERDRDGRERAGPPTFPQGAVGLVFNVGGQLVRLAPDQLRELPADARQVGGPHLLALDLAADAARLADAYAQVDPEPGEDGKRAAEQTRAMAQALDDEVAKANTAYERARAQPQNQKLDAQVQLALRNNLVGEALRLLNDPGTDLAREFGPTRALGVVLARVALELATGRLEDAAAHLDATVGDPAVRQARANPTFTRHYLQLTYQRLFQEGDYGEAGKVVELFADEFAQDPPAPGQVDTRAFTQFGAVYPSAALLGAASPLDVLGKHALLEVLPQPFLVRQQEMRNRRLGLAEFYYRRGLLFLLQGDIPEARRRFEMAAQKGDKDWGVPDIRNTDAERFLGLITEAEKGGG
jgi:tetratricopeptide (TPR) repeat protein